MVSAGIACAGPPGATDSDGSFSKGSGANFRRPLLLPFRLSGPTKDSRVPLWNRATVRTVLHVARIGLHVPSSSPTPNSDSSNLTPRGPTARWSVTTGPWQPNGPTPETEQGRPAGLRRRTCRYLRDLAKRRLGHSHVLNNPASSVGYLQAPQVYARTCPSDRGSPILRELFMGLVRYQPKDRSRSLDKRRNVACFTSK